MAALLASHLGAAGVRFAAAQDAAPAPRDQRLADLVQSAADQTSVDGIPLPLQYDVRAIAAPATPVPAPALPDLSRFTVSAVRAMIPPRIEGGTVALEPLKVLPFIPTANIADMSQLWREQGDRNPQAIVLSDGVFDLDRVAQLLGRPDILKRQAETVFLLRRPLVVSPTATLIIRDATWLRLDVDAGVMFVNNGLLIMVDSKLSSWSEKEQGYGTRSEDGLPENELLFYDRSKPRPYYLAQSGSKTFIANSEIAGLGYKGEKSFGLSFASGPSGSGLKRVFATQAWPMGWLIGNRIHDLFFGLYTNQAEDLVVVANEVYDNVIYGLDPHDYSERLILARNICRNSRHAHGIIVSRSVNDSWIFQNIVFANRGSGIMLDRSSEHNVVADNLSFNNGGDGITVQESSNNFVLGNRLYYNARDGIYVRNSKEVSIAGNNFYRNGKSGVELGVVDINYLETRDFQRDPFEAYTSASIRTNDFRSNVNSAISVKNADGLSIAADNKFKTSGPLLFSGDLETYGGEISEVLFLKGVDAVIRKRPSAGVDGLPNTAADSGARN